MNNQRISEILRNKDIKDIYYQDEPVWIQEVHNNIATVGFLNSSSSKDIYIDELYEKDLYN